MNVSTVGGRSEFAASIHGAQDDPSFFATGISLVAHMANPHVPAVHMNTRFLATTKRWFGGGADLNPAIPSENTEAFHARLRAACAAHDPTFYPRFSKWAEDYSKFRTVAFRAGLAESSTTISNARSLAKGRASRTILLSRARGEAFLDIFPKIVRGRRDTPFNDEDMRRLLEFRGRYVEFNAALRSRHVVRPEDGREHRRHPHEPSAPRCVEMSYDDVRTGDVAAVVTFLEMRETAQQEVPASAFAETDREPPARCLPHPVPADRLAMALVLASCHERCGASRDHPASGRPSLRRRRRGRPRGRNARARLPRVG